MTTPQVFEEGTEEPGKYIVFKREEFAKWWNQATVGGSVHTIATLREIPDAVVIRRQDLFAPTALHSYANSIGISVRLTDDSDRAKQLQKVADYFHSQAVLAEAEAYKLPGD